MGARMNLRKIQTIGDTQERQREDMQAHHILVDMLDDGFQAITCSSFSCDHTIRRHSTIGSSASNRRNSNFAFGQAVAGSLNRNAIAPWQCRYL